jgi:hypothetical protein
MTDVLKTLFSWPNGIVLGNLIASALWATPALIHQHRKLNRHHEEHLAAIKEKKS